MDPFEERRLVPLLVAMDDDAWRELCRQYAGSLANFARMCFGCDSQKAQEIVQMTFVRCVRSIGTFDPSRGGLLNWLRAIARHEGMTLLGGPLQGRREVPLSMIPSQISQNIAALIDRQPLPPELLERQDVHELVHRCLAAMGQRHRDVLVMKYLEGLSVADIAVRLGLSEKATESLLTRSREKFKGLVEGKVAAAEMLE
jgi:RNA polymerase sigma-70 factor (ECF subfamily)